ncbi:hypothetical protein ENUP19_0149G0006 [Entamoeba nuttalli]|uniref:Legume family lectin family protein, membrane-bound, putative n=2 Tax=Entamoeba nuttalli TaxID=412467 RepID=K2GG51_ENTNP|nr:Legume family lectin family protein, membrane-bound, putative [Entamoeba nuttalli P19]EKE41661.1 Legume family lectin family protein, membrane-bound, putative [Entamoeba nuttalli P19]|eukprot:XP_008856003.1 Legume family lectin family protein, membrane-bound, putative [Entamoeba nuttalli P19]
MKLVIVICLFIQVQSERYNAASQPNEFQIKGDAYTNGRYMYITADKKSQKGMVSLKKRIISDYFNVTYEFSLLSISNKKHGDGMAFWLTPEQLDIGTALGGQEQWKGLAIFVDTFQNSYASIPSIQLIYNDGTLTYEPKRDGIDISKRTCSFTIDRNSPQRLTVNYINGKINIDFNNEQCTYYNQKLPKGLVVSVSGLTGELSDTQILNSIEIEDITPSTTHNINPHYIGINLDSITREFTALELGRESSYNLKIIYDTIHEIDKSTAITKKFVIARQQQLNKILESLENVPKGLPTKAIDQFISTTTIQLGNLYDLYESMRQTADDLLERIRKNTILQEKIVVNKLTIWDYLLFLNGIILASVLVYITLKVIHSQSNNF